MHRSKSAAALLVAASAGVLLAAQEQRQPPFRSGAKTVAVYATVSDKDGRLVPDLAARRLRDPRHGKPQPITVFSNEVQPITVVMMLDRSGSMRGNVGLVEQAAEEFVKGLRPDDKARIGIFAERIDIQPAAFASDRRRCSAFSGPSSRSAVRRRSGTRSTRPSARCAGRKAAKWCSCSATAATRRPLRAPGTAAHGRRHAPRGAGGRDALCDRSPDHGAAAAEAAAASAA